MYFPTLTDPVFSNKLSCNPKEKKTLRNTVIFQVTSKKATPFWTLLILTESRFVQIT